MAGVRNSGSARTKSACSSRRAFSGRSELGTIHVDRCGLCGGTYFDAGELDHVVLKKEQDGRGFFRKLIGI